MTPERYSETLSIRGAMSRKRPALLSDKARGTLLPGSMRERRRKNAFNAFQVHPALSVTAPG